ncbi:MAG TPA: OsmC family protein [Steroidobacteraceae bacterium]|nr:OsmC family protein [Steroidobacteraceae bacterium]
MQAYPHKYTVTANGSATGTVPVAATGLPMLDTESPREFDGPGDQWSPENMLCAAVASCFILTFRAVAKASKQEWRQLACHVEGTLERVERETRFTLFATHVVLVVPRGADRARCQQLLEKSERACLIANSLRAERMFDIDIKEV